MEGGKGGSSSSGMEMSPLAASHHDCQAHPSLLPHGFQAHTSTEADEDEEEEEPEEEEDDDSEDPLPKEIAHHHVQNKGAEPHQSSSSALGVGIDNPALQRSPLPPTQRGAKRFRASTAKERISKMPPCAAGKRSSIYRGVTRHRWTGRYEAHLWDKSTWNQNQNKKGKQVYLGAYDDEEAAARAYDLAALKYWGPGTLINFPVSDYARDIDEMQNISREDYLASLRRKSSGFSRGVSKSRGVSRAQSGTRWDLQAGTNFASTLPQLGIYGTLGDGGTTNSTIGYSGLGSSTTRINLCHFLNWLQPPNFNGEVQINVLKKSSKAFEEALSPEEQQLQQQSSACAEEFSDCGPPDQVESNGPNKPWQCCEPYELPSLGLCNKEKETGISALDAISQSVMFAKLEERLHAAGTGWASGTRVASESAAEALAAAMAMEDSTESPSSVADVVEETTCPLGHGTTCPLGHGTGYGDISYGTGYGDISSPFALPPLVPLAMDHCAHLSDQIPCLWNPLEPSLSIICRLP